MMEVIFRMMEVICTGVGPKNAYASKNVGKTIANSIGSEE